MSDSSLQDYDAQVRAIKAYNQPILDAFQAWLEQSGLSAQTVSRRVRDIDFFTEYLVYEDPLKRLDEAHSGDVWAFLAHWYLRKAIWSSVAGVKSYLVAFKKFFLWMGETDRVSHETVTAVLDTLKKDRNEFLAAAAKDAAATESYRADAMDSLRGYLSDLYGIKNL